MTGFFGPRNKDSQRARRFMSSSGWSTPNVVALLRFNGANGSKTFIDEVAGNTWTAVGTATQSTSAPIAGSASGLFAGGTDSYIQCVGQAAFALGTADFTIEIALKASVLSTRGIFHTQLSSSAAGIAVGYDNAANRFQLYNNGVVTNSLANLIATGTIYRLALERFGSSLVLYLDGSAIISTTTAVNVSTTTFYVGVYYNNQFCWNGTLDEFRVTAGLARYKGAYTPQTTEFIYP